MILSLRIALKFHRGSNNNVLISLVSLIAIISIAIGITMSIIALSAINGFKYELSHRILAVIPHIEIEPVSSTSIVDWLMVLNRVRQMPEIVCANPYINFSGVIEFNNKWHVVYVRSIDVTRTINENTLSYFVEKDFSWKYFYENKEQIILGKGVSDALGIKVGDWITILIAHNFRMDNKLLSSKKIRLQVASILNLNSQLDFNFAVMSLLDVQYLYHKTSDITGIAIKINDIFYADRIARKIEKILNHQVYVRSWMDTYGYIYRDIQMVRVIIYLSMILIMSISCFNVIATLILSIKDKNYDIALICALGGQNILIRCIFFWYGLIIYIISSVVGTGLGVFISFNLTSVMTICNDLLGNKILSKGIYFINFLPIKLNGRDVLLVLGITLLLGVVTSWYTVLKTKKVDLSKILK